MILKEIAKQVLEAEYGSIIITAQILFNGLNPLSQDRPRLEQFAIQLSPVEGFLSFFPGICSIYLGKAIPVAIEMDLLPRVQLQEAGCRMLPPHIQDSAIQRIVRIFPFMKRPIINGRGKIIFKFERIGISYPEGESAIFAVGI